LTPYLFRKPALSLEACPLSTPPAADAVVTPGHACSSGRMFARGALDLCQSGSLLLPFIHLLSSSFFLFMFFRRAFVRRFLSCLPSNSPFFFRPLMRSPSVSSFLFLFPPWRVGFFFNGHRTLFEPGFHCFPFRGSLVFRPASGQSFNPFPHP